MGSLGIHTYLLIRVPIPTSPLAPLSCADGVSESRFLLFAWMMTALFAFYLDFSVELSLGLVAWSIYEWVSSIVV